MQIIRNQLNSKINNLQEPYKQNKLFTELSKEAKMIFQRTADEMSSWRNQMKQYQKNKRTKKPFGKSLPHVSHVTYEDVKNRENKFNPVLQTYKFKEDEQRVDSLKELNRVKTLINHIKNKQKYQKDYDVVNLHPNQGVNIEEKPMNKKLGPIRNAYNVINNQKLPDFYFKGRDLQIPQPRQKNLIDYHKKEFDIITGDYKQHNDEKQKFEKEVQNEHVYSKYWKTHNYDPIYGRFYDANKQVQYQKDHQKQLHEHGKDNDKKLPQSYVYREPLILDFQKPLPQTLMKLDQKQQNKKKKYQLKYVIQDQYGHRNDEEQEKQDKIIKNRVHDGRLLDQKSKQFNIISNINYPTNRAEALYGKKLKINSWDEYLKPSDNPAKAIKTSGFN